MRRQNKTVAGLLILFLGMLWGGALAQEHPKEHPKEQPKSGGAAGVTKDQLADAITAWVASESKKTGGKLEVKDPLENKTLRLTLDKVHKERLAAVSPGLYFACADFTGEDGATYDLDMFMKGPDKDHLTMSEVSIHKKNGKERYTWAEEGGFWKKKPVS